MKRAWEPSRRRQILPGRVARGVEHAEPAQGWQHLSFLQHPVHWHVGKEAGPQAPAPSWEQGVGTSISVDAHIVSVHQDLGSRPPPQLRRAAEVVGMGMGDDNSPEVRRVPAQRLNVAQDLAGAAGQPRIYEGESLLVYQEEDVASFEPP